MLLLILLLLLRKPLSPVSGTGVQDLTNPFVGRYKVRRTTTTAIMVKIRSEIVAVRAGVRACPRESCMPVVGFAFDTESGGGSSWRGGTHLCIAVVAERAGVRLWRFLVFSSRRASLRPELTLLFDKTIYLSFPLAL